MLRENIHFCTKLFKKKRTKNSKVVVQVRDDHMKFLIAQNFVTNIAGMNIAFFRQLWLYVNPYGF